MSDEGKKTEIKQDDKKHRFSTIGSMFAVDMLSNTQLVKLKALRFIK